MLELIGVDGLTQWDVGRQVKVDKDVDMVHFSNRPYGYSKNVKVTDGVADVPDMFLTSCAPLRIWAYIGDFEKGYTKIEKIYEVKPKNRPEDYIYTPEEVKTWEKLQSEIGDLANLVTEKKNNLVAAINEAAQSGGGGAGSGSDISLGLTSASVGQIIKVKAIDESGKPTEWEAVDDKLPNPTPSDAYNVLSVDRIGEFEYGYVFKPMPDINEFISLGITSASPGQIAKVKFVDNSGSPTAWEAVDMPSGGSGGGETWEAINAITLSDVVNTVTINTDSGGNAIALKKVRILVEGSASNNQDLFFNNSRYLRANVVGSEASVGALSAEPFCGKMYCYAVTNINANYGFSNQIATTFSDEITITEIKLIVNNNGKFSAGTKFTIQGVRA